MGGAVDDDTTDDDAPPEDATDATRREGHGTRAKKLAPEYLARGTLVGRYVVLERLGEGGMGVVYRAFDPELDRKVALKLLQARPQEGSSGGSQAWLLREAQALARLAHPNVISVHDVGTLPGDRVFVAMELVDGMTLRAWLKAKDRSWREIVPVMRAAGAGLAAAHAAGLIHRDFKPDNVLVGNDGRVRVLDFGLARLRTDSDPESEQPSSERNLDAKSPLSESLTVAGTVVGTPAYMAPEIFDGKPVDARTDQFSFGVSLYEALYRVRPYVKEDLVPPRETVPRPRLPSEPRAVPAKLARVAARAIAIDPAARYASMDALLAELTYDPGAARRRAVIAAGALAAAAASTAGAIAWFSARDQPPPCQNIESRLADVWDASTRKKIDEAFAGTKLPHAPRSFARLAIALDGYANEWLATSVESCRATRVRRDQTEEIMSLRQACLDQRLTELGALTKVLASADAGLVDKGEKVVSELDPVAGCSNIVALRAPDRPAPELLAPLAEAGKKLAEAKALVIAGKQLPALVASQQAADAARKIGYGPFEAEALYTRGVALMAIGNSVDAAPVLTDAVTAALRGHRDGLAANAAITVGMITADMLGRPADAKTWIVFAEALAKRSGVERSLESQLYNAVGLIAVKNGDVLAGAAAHEKAFAAAERNFGRDSPMLWSQEVVLATTLTTAHADEKAVAHFEHAISLREQAVGPDHPDIASVLTNLGTSYRQLGDPKKARAAYDRALAIREKSFGKKNPILILTLNNYADYLKSTGDMTAAFPLIERSRQIAVMLGVEHPLYHFVMTTYAEITGGLGRVAEARKLFDDLLATEKRVHSATLPVTLVARAELELAQKRWVDAAAYAEQAIAAYEAAGGESNPELTRSLTRLAQARLGRGQPAAARPLLERALAIGEKAHMSEAELAEPRKLLSALPK